MTSSYSSAYFVQKIWERRSSQKHLMMLALAVIALSLILLASAESEKKLPKLNEDKFSCEPYETECALGCCPFPDAVCCSDGYECCPSGTTCIPYLGICVGFNEKNQTVRYEKRVVIKPKFQDQKMVYQTEKTIEDDNQFEVCPSGTTPLGAGCCPWLNPSLCADRVHCCPNGYTCNVILNGCTRGSNFLPFFEKPVKSPSSQEFQNTAMSPKTRTYYEVQGCPYGTTPCGAGCCPLPNAVCCSDGIHCCPNGYTCNYAVGKCTRGSHSTTFSQKTEQILLTDPENINVESIVSTDQQIQACPYGTTPCKGGCCPFPRAVCCSDGIHCCPNGYICNYAVGKCTRGSHSTSFFQTIQNILFTDPENIAVTSLASADQQIQACPYGMTPCGSGCCPLPNAVCCSDGIHCCPKGYTCNYTVEGCTKGSYSMPFRQKIKKIFFTETENSVVTSIDSDEENLMACPTRQGRCITGCCPVSNPVCCSDKVHCCPNGYICNYQAGGCTMGPHLTPFQKITREFSFLDPENFVPISTASADHQIQPCPPRTTPCGVGCCPLPSAVCCSDELHCCPNGYKCNYDIGRCTRGSDSLPFLQRIRKLIASAVDMKKVVHSKISDADNNIIQRCPDGTTSCGDGCCPFPKAVCCSDGIHCCPNGYSCDNILEICVKS